MTKTTMLAAVLLASAAGVAHAGGSEGSIGVGAEYILSSFTVVSGVGATPVSVGIGGPSINYDAGKFHVGGFFSVIDPEGANNTTIEFGGRFYYHVHSTAMSDFGVGGTLGILNYDTGRNRNTNLYLEPGFQFRAFVATNVAISLSGGIAIGAVDASGVALLGNVTGAAGIHYYFF